MRDHLDEYIKLFIWKCEKASMTHKETHRALLNDPMYIEMMRVMVEIAMMETNPSKIINA
jgi:hypothetical protein